MSKMTPTKSARAFCLWCCNDQIYEPANCAATKCILYPFRQAKGRITLRTIKCFCKVCCQAYYKDVKNCQFDGEKEEKCQLYDYRLGKRPRRGVAIKGSKRRK